MKQQCHLAADLAEPEEALATPPVGVGRPPRDGRRRKGQSGSPGGQRRRTDDLVALVRAALDRPATIVEDGKRRRGNKREQIVSQLVERSARSDLQATKLLVALIQKVSAGVPDGDLLDEADEKVITTFLARLGMAE